MRGSWSFDAGAPAMPVAFALAGGILLGVLLPLPVPAALLVALGLAGSAGVLRRRRAFVAVVAFALGLHFGRHRVLEPALGDAALAAELGGERTVEIEARVLDPWARSGGRARTRVAVVSAAAAGKPLQFRAPIVLVVEGADEGSRVAALGETVRALGTLRVPRVDAPRTPFVLPPAPRLVVRSARLLERRSGPRGPFAPVLVLHGALLDRLDTCLEGASPRDRAAVALALAFLMGETAQLPVETTAAFRDGGVAHILAISGTHVTLLAALLTIGLARSSLRVPQRDLVVLLATAAYAVFAGGRPPVLRAAVMIGVYLVARLVGRPTSPAQVVGLSLGLLLLASPGDVLDVGFLLSFTAVLGITSFGIPLARVLAPHLPRPLADGLAVTLGAELAVLPIQLFVFHVVPVSSNLANLVVVPLSTLFLLLALATVPLLAISPGAASVCVVPLRLSAELMVSLLEGFDRFWALRTVPAPPFSLVLLVAGLLALAAWRKSQTAVAVALLVTVALAVRPSVTTRPGVVRMQAVDVGQGDSWLLVTPEGRVLIDGGGSGDLSYEFGALRLVPKLARLGAVSLDAVVLTHPDPDHARGLVGALRRLPTDLLVVAGGAARDENLEDVLDSARFRGVPSRRVFAGESFETAGLFFEVLGPRRDPYPRAARNNGSVVLRTRLGGREPGVLRRRGARRALFTGDAEKLAEGELLAAGGMLAADLLKVGHHGSRTSSAEAFLAAVNPRLAFLGAGATNRFGHPAPEVLERFASRGVRVLRTDLHGDFAIEIEGRTVRPLFAPHPTEGFAR